MSWSSSCADNDCHMSKYVFKKSIEIFECMACKHMLEIPVNQLDTVVELHTYTSFNIPMALKDLKSL